MDPLLLHNRSESSFNISIDSDVSNFSGFNDDDIAEAQDNLAVFDNILLPFRTTSGPGFLALGQFNAWSLSTSKADDIYFHASLLGLDVISIAETWFGNDTHDGLIFNNFLGDFSIFRADRDGRGGGAAVLTKKHFNATELKVPETVMPKETVVVKLQHSSWRSPLIIVSIYRAQGDVNQLQQLRALLGWINKRYQRVILTGDINADLLSPNEREAVAVRDMYVGLGMQCCIDEPTRVQGDAATLIDHIAVTNAVRVKKAFVLDNVPADHRMIGAIFDIRKPRQQFKMWWSRDFRNFDRAAYLNDLHRAFQVITDSDNLENDSRRLVEAILEVANKHAPRVRRRARANTLPWVDQSPYIKRLMGLRSRLLKMSIPSPGTPADPIIRQLYKTVRNRVNMAVKWAKKNYFAELFARCSNLSKYWALIKKSTGSNRTEQQIAALSIPESGRVVRDGQEIADCLVDHFTSVASKVSGHLSPTFNQLPSPERPTLDTIQISADRVIRLLEKLDTRSATGDDGLSPRLLKEGAEAIGPFLARFIQRCFDAGIYPSNWKSARISALFKKGLRDLRDNYRPISVIPAVSKIPETIMVEDMDSFDQENNITAPEQWAFRKGRSTELTLVHITETIRDGLNRGRKVVMLCVDVQKAYDCVRADILLRKLSDFGIKGAFLEWLKSYLKGRRQFVAVNGHISASSDVQCGIPQGSCLGPRAFSVFINDLPAAVETPGCTTVLYADDISAIIEGGSTDEVIMRANVYLDKLKGWMDHNCMVVHPLKTEAVWFTRNNRKDPPAQRAVYDNTPIDWVGSVKLLGVHLDCQLSFIAQGEDVLKRFSSKIRLISQLKFMPREPLLRFYNSVVLPQVLYGVLVWGSTTKTLWEKIERRHAQAAKLIFGLPWDTHGPTALETAGLSPLSQNYKEQLMKLAYTATFRNCPADIQKRFFPLQTERARHDTRARLDFRFPAPHVLGIIVNSVSRRAAALWNSVSPLELKAASSRAALTRRMKTNTDLIDSLRRFYF